MAVCCFIKYEQVRSAATSYGNIILGKIKLPAVNDDEGEGFIHVRFVLPLLVWLDVWLTAVSGSMILPTE